MVETDKHLEIFLEMLENKEIVYRDGALYRYVKSRKVYKRIGRKTTKGYMQLTKKLNGKEVNAVEHRVIYCYLNGLKELTAGMQINHKNGIKHDNKIENLELVTPSENQKHAYENNLKPRQTGENNPDAKLTNKQALQIKDMILDGKNNKEIADLFDVTPQNIYLIRKGKSWASITGFNAAASLRRVDVEK